MLKDTTRRPELGSNPRPLAPESDALPLGHHASLQFTVKYKNYGDMYSFLSTEMFIYCLYISQVEKQKEKLSGSQLWLSLPARFKFYRGCADKFQKYGVSVAKVVEYFEVTLSIIKRR